MPQYYVTGNHEAIISPAVWDFVQAELAATCKGQCSSSRQRVFSGKIGIFPHGDEGFQDRWWHSRADRVGDKFLDDTEYVQFLVNDVEMGRTELIDWQLSDSYVDIDTKYLRRKCGSLKFEQRHVVASLALNSLRHENFKNSRVDPLCEIVVGVPHEGLVALDHVKISPFM